MLESVARTVSGIVVPGCGHFLPEESPDTIIHAAREAAERSA